MISAHCATCTLHAQHDALHVAQAGMIASSAMARSLAGRVRQEAPDQVHAANGEGNASGEEAIHQELSWCCAPGMKPGPPTSPPSIDPGTAPTCTWALLHQTTMQPAAQAGDQDAELAKEAVRFEAQVARQYELLHDIARWLEVSRSFCVVLGSCFTFLPLLFWVDRRSKVLCFSCCRAAAWHCAVAGGALVLGSIC